MKKEIVKMSCYDTFRCSADRCRFTCCQQWKIAVDEATETAWTKQGMASSITTRDEARVIALNEWGECPYLNEKKLCSLVIEHGDGMIPRTCQIFPRQVHKFADRTEYALVACCPDVVDWLSQTDEVLAASDLVWGPGAAVDAAGVPEAVREACVGRMLRDWMICQVQDSTYSVEKNLKMIFYILLELFQGRQKDLPGQLQACVKAIPELAAAIDDLPKNRADSMLERNELFLDVTENYWRQGMYREQLAPLREAAERLEATEAEILAGQAEDFAREMGQYDKWFRNYLVCELFANALLPDTGLPELLVMVQWIAMEYAMIRHGLFLHSLRGPVSYEALRELVVVIARMTGYDLDDIEEYFENSFESVIWEWGYLALLLPE